MAKPKTMTADELTELLGPEAAGWLALGLDVYRGGWYTPNQDDPQLQVKVFHNGEMIGWTNDTPGRPGERQYRSLAHTDLDGLPYGEIYADGLPADPVSSHREARDRLPS
ncbi:MULTISPECIES: hypothetical protein [unclassified Streptomyces]|uniref:hypothetical protein n=1 Tax=unclassified Streptomyces TaxID=2593676 RepID=UPI002F915E3B|nr:hypothetical protein OG832_45425 [Streptomyces sp. NBC_00826]WTB60481.1 hypothetical protein OG832_46475 [Streptomyces sp. NBC_00826]